MSAVGQAASAPDHGPLTLWAAQAWVQGRWQADVCLRTDAQGRWATVDVGHPCPEGARVLAGPVLPGLVDAHGHAFQRAFAGLAERRTAAHDDFWSWRDRMYGVAARIDAPTLRDVATALYAELLEGGFTEVCEFHYLHHPADGGSAPDDAPPMARALAEAAAEVGIGLTLLPVLYERAGFTQPALRPDQRRFACTPAQVLAWRDTIRAWGLPNVGAGVAIHSLRAASPEAILALVAGCGDDPGPIHVHVAEQTAEVDDCLAATGLRPIDWLATHLRLDPRWQLVHATHATPQEIERVGAAGAGVVICPSTEANLGDGLCDLPRWLASGAALSVGTDSHVTRHWPGELQLLEYGQRLQARRRNVAADPGAHAGATDSTAARLFERLGHGGAAASGAAAWGLCPGARADWLVLDTHAGGLRGVPAPHRLDALVFGAGAPAFSEVGVAGRLRVRGGRALDSAAIGARFEHALRTLWRDGA